MSAPLPPNEEERLKALRALKVLDTLPETYYDEITHLATRICEVPISVVSLIDECRQWFKSKKGIEIDETPRDVAFCAYAILSTGPLIVPDALEDERFKDNPSVAGEPHIRFYAGFPLVSEKGFVLGTICLIDTKPKALTETQIESMKVLAKATMSQLELRMTVSQLTLESQKYEVLVNNLKAVVFQLDSLGRWRFLNPAWTEITHYTIEESIGRAFIDFVHPDDTQASIKRFGEVRSSKTSFRHRVRYCRKDGSTRSLEVFAKSIYDSDGITTGITGTLTDITDQLDQEKLIEDQRIHMIQSARLSSLGEMAAGIAHEINNPLTIIRGTVQIMSKNLNSPQSTPENTLQQLEKVDSTVERIAKIISGLRSFARDGSQDSVVSTSIKQLIQETLDLCQTRFRNHNVELLVEAPEGEFSIKCRPIQISQVLVNLLNNAFDAVSALPQDERWVKIKLEVEDTNLAIKIIDSGTGILTDLQAKIMQPFFTTKPIGKGTGLGLSLSTGIMQSHSGSLVLDPTAKNTTFVIRMGLDRDSLNQIS